MQRLDVLPIFLQERKEEINTLMDDGQCSSIDTVLTQRDISVLI